MRIPRFFLEQALTLHREFELPNSLFRHAVQVLKLSVNEPLIIFNGQGGEYQGILTQVEKRRALCVLQSFNDIERESPLRLKLVQSIIKPDKMDWALQKSVELGVTEIQPLQSQRTIIRLDSKKLQKKHEHWQAVIHSACEQSGRTSIPKLHPIITLPAYLSQYAKQEQVFLLDPQAKHPIPSVLQNLQNIDQTHPTYSVLIGPEGGFTDSEVDMSLAAGCQGTSLGSRVLRAETASLTAISLLQHYLGDLA